MQHQSIYDQIVKTIDTLDYFEQLSLLNHIKRIVNPGKKTGQGSNGKDTSWLGCLSEQTEILGDISAPVIEEKEWEVLSE